MMIKALNNKNTAGEVEKRMDREVTRGVMFKDRPPHDIGFINLLYAIYLQAIEDAKDGSLPAYNFLQKDPYGFLSDGEKDEVKRLCKRD